MLMRRLRETMTSESVTTLVAHVAVRDRHAATPILGLAPKRMEVTTRVTISTKALPP